MNWNKKLQKHDGSLASLLMKKIHPEWRPFINKEAKNDYFKLMYRQLKHEVVNGKYNMFPEPENCFRVFIRPLSQIKVVILGQDPYYRESLVKDTNNKDNTIKVCQACGLSFSVTPPVCPPASLKNIYKELDRDPNVDFTKPGNNGDLSYWADQGVFLLNTALTVREGKPTSHMRIWRTFTDRVIEYLSEQGLKVFILWGRQAQAKANLLNNDKNKIIMTSHPSPLSAKRGFLGSNCFSECNEWLRNNGVKEINWNLS